MADLATLRAHRDDLAERLDALETAAERAADLGLLGPSPVTLEHGRRLLAEAEAALAAEAGGPRR